MYYVYMLKCRDNSLYTGYTNNIEKRLKKHNEGVASKYTRSRLPVEVVYHEEYENRGKAMSREANIKKMDRESKLKLIGWIRE